METVQEKAYINLLIFYSQHPRAGLRYLLTKEYWIWQKISGLLLLPFQLLQKDQLLIINVRCHLKDLSIFILIQHHCHWWLLQLMNNQNKLENLLLPFDVCFLSICIDSNSVTENKARKGLNYTVTTAWPCQFWFSDLMLLSDLELGA